LRAEVLQGRARAEGIGALVYHGMVTGLLMLASAPAPPAAVPPRDIRTLPHDRQFVRLLANMLLRTQSEAMHVY
jgi:hypothetical protein